MGPEHGSLTASLERRGALCHVPLEAVVRQASVSEPIFLLCGKQQITAKFEQKYLLRLEKTSGNGLVSTFLQR